MTTHDAAPTLDQPLPIYRYAIRVSWEIAVDGRKKPTVGEQVISVLAESEATARDQALAWHESSNLGGRPSILSVDKVQ